MKSPKAIEVKGEWAEPMGGQHTKKAAKPQGWILYAKGMEGYKM